MAAFYRKRITALQNEVFEEELKIKTLKKEENDVRRQLQEYNVTEEIQTGEITLKINSTLPKTIPLSITYKVSKAAWFPIYDISASKVNQPLEIRYKAHVFQNTGVAWDKVQLQLSTDDPNTNNTKPNLGSQYLNFINPYTYKRRDKATSYNYKYNPTIKKVTGIVLDNAGLPLPGASIVVSGTATGVQTDYNGRYNLEVQEGQELDISYVGYTTKTIPIHASTINVELDVDDTLEEVVITAQGIKREAYANGYATNEALKGKVSGLEINQSSGVVGSGSNIVIRGNSSIPKSKNVLYIIDGNPSTASYAEFISPDMITSINVLKGLEAATLYGTEGRNGVVIITTKNANKTAEGLLIDESLTSVRFQLEGTHTLLPDNDITVIKIDNFNVPATFEYLAVPVLNENTFLTAKIGQWEKYSLLPGEANIYFEGGYAGKTYINPLTIQEELTISLGVDPNVTVKRKEIDDFKSKSFIGNTRILNKAYTITVKNNKNTTVAIKLMDRIPISQNKEIKVTDLVTGDAIFKKVTGLLSWELKLDSKESISKEMSYELRFPKHKSISL